jgi:hypothetical protein
MSALRSAAAIPSGDVRIHVDWSPQSPTTRGKNGLACVLAGRPLRDLEAAVSDSLDNGAPGLPFAVWSLEDGQARRLLFCGSLSLEKRAWARSIYSVAASVADLLAAAHARMGVEPAGELAASAVVPASRKTADAPAARLAAAIWQRLARREQWQLEIFSQDGGGRAIASRRLVPPRDQFWADPFVWNAAGRPRLFFEVLPFATGRGHLACLDLDERLRPLGDAHEVLREPWHLSYPFLWEEEGRLYVIPESAAHGALELYEWNEAARRLEHRCRLIDGRRLADATLLRWRGRLWLMCTSASPGGSLNDSLHLFHSERLQGPWQAHPMNPVKVCARTARPAGAAWLEDGVPHRVVQDCTQVYGGAVRCMRITQLDDLGFAEEEVSGWRPAQTFAGKRWHTYNRHGNFAVADVMCTRWRYP